MSGLLTYKPHPTIERFHNSNKKVRAIMSAYGTGKTYACCVEIILRCSRQVPNAQGIRYSRVMIIRNTIGELKKTVLQEFLKVVGGEVSNLGRLKKQEMKYELDYPICNAKGEGDGTRVKADIHFIALELEKSAKRGVLSLNSTMAYFCEAKMIKLHLFWNDVYNRNRLKTCLLYTSPSPRD